MLYALDGVVPDAALGYVAPGARLIGDVRLGDGASVWFNAVLRGDSEPITLGRATNVQDGVVGHADPGFPLTLEDEVSVGHSAIIHGCLIGAGSLIGMGAVLLNGARIGRGCLVGARALVTEGKEFPDGALIIGQPANVARMLEPDEIARLRRTAETYRRRALQYRAGLAPL